jgi:signal transduction histidine kinase
MKHLIGKHIDRLWRHVSVRRHLLNVSRWLMTFIVLLCSQNLAAQNNIYKIDDELYSLYQRGFKEKLTEKSLAIADTMITLARRKGDKKGECIAYTLPLQHYYYTHEMEKFEGAVENLKQVSRRNGYPQYYYHASNMYITRMLNDGETLVALQENARMHSEAFEKQEHFGILSCIKNMARVQTARGNLDLANKYWREALDYQLEFVNEQDPTQLYIELCDYSRYKNRFKEALDYNRRGMESAHTKLARTKLVMQKCHIYFNMHDYKSFMKSYKEALKLEKESHIEPTDLRLLTMHMCERIINNDPDSAMYYADKQQRLEARLMWRSRICEYFGRYDEALKYYKESRVMNDSIRNAVQASDIAELNSQIGTRLLEAELEHRERESMELQLKQAQQQVEMEQQRAANEHLKLANQELEMNRLKSDKLLLDTENDRQRIVLDRRLEEAHYQRQIMMVAAIASFVILTGLLIALIRHRYMLQELNKKNSELEIARDQANSANKMKTIFIQNMSHEIRTPLNSIVGFSQILSTPGMDVSPEEAEEYGRIIQHNSELLTSLVNDLLGLAELESGKYTLNKETVGCNEMCREAISTVMYRKPERVDLRYTSDVDDSFRLHTDARRVKQVLINYLTNAEKHTDDGYIELGCSLKSNPGKVTFSVTDTGCGVSPENVEKVFDRFEKLNNFETGFGLGLSICRAIADRMNGTVHLDTSYTNGARFLFIIPLEKAA